MRLAERFTRQAEAMQGKEAEWLRIAAISARKIGTPHPDLPGQDLGSHEILQQLIRRIERACARAGWRPLPGPVVGTLNENTINAFCSSFFGTTSLVVLHSSTLTFVLLLTKCILPAICARTPEGGLALGGRPDAAQLREAARRLAQLILAIKLEKDPRAAPSYMPPQGWIFRKLVYLFIESIELFIVAHEYGHLMGDHGRRPFDIDSDLPVVEELQADLFAALVAILDRPSDAPELRLIAPLVMFKMLSLMEKDGVVPMPVEHPPSEARLAFLRDDIMAEHSRQTHPGLLQILHVFSTVESRIEEAWAAATVRRDVACELQELLERCIGDNVPDYATFQVEARYIFNQDYLPDVLEEAAAVARRFTEDMKSFKNRSGERVAEDDFQNIKASFHKYKLLFSIIPDMKEPARSLFEAALDLHNA